MEVEQGGDSQAEVSNTLDQDIAEAIREIDARESAESEEPTAEVDSDEVEASDESEEVESSDDSVEAESDDEPEGIVKTDSDEDFSIPEPLEHWSDTDKAVFESLEDDKKRWWLDKVKSLEKGYQEKFEEVAEYRKEKSAFDGIFSPYDAQLESSGMTRVDIVNRLISAQQYLESKPQEALEWLARSYGVELGKPDSPNTLDDEYLDEPSREIRELRHQVAELKQATEQERQYKEQFRQQETQAKIDSFAGETSEDGQLLRPYFGDVEGHMTALIKQGQAKDLQDAYDQAVWANPTTRAKVMEEQEKAKESRRKEEVKKAKKAGKNVKAKQPTPKSEVEEVPEDLNALISGEFAKMKQSA